MVDYCEFVKMTFAKILDFLLRLKSFESKLVPKLPQGI